ncbi:MAG: hypothetical protein R2824_15020 [Saprospiraceae bacterium]|nr:hypothetical protein [Lewinella sp.]
MTIVGNIFLVIAGLIYLALSSMLFSRQPPPGGDYAVGYAWTLVLGNAAFTLCLTIVVAIIGSKGGFDWVAIPGAPRFMIVTGAYILIMLAYNFFAMKEGTGDLPPLARQVVAYLPGLLPLLLLSCAAILLNDDWRAAVPVAVYKWPLLLTAILGLLPLGLIMQHNARNAAAVAKDRADFISRTEQAHLDQIDSTDVQKAMVNILVFTDANHKAEVRERALERIRSRPDWQEELIRLLDTNGAPEVFTFLASNEVEDKTMFKNSVEAGIYVQARLIRQSIRNCRGTYDLYSGRFGWEVERVLRSVQKFQGMGVDYQPAIREMRAALDEPTSFEKPRLNCIPVLDKWLEKN